MQGNLFLILSLLLSSCLAHKSLSSTQSSIDSESKFLSELKSHKMGKILMGLAEITPSGDIDSLLDALDVLESSLEQKIKTQNDLYSNAENLHDSAVGTYKATIESLEIGIADLQQSLNCCRTVLVTFNNKSLMPILFVTEKKATMSKETKTYQMPRNP